MHAYTHSGLYVCMGLLIIALTQYISMSPV